MFTSRCYLELAIAKRCRSNKLVRQRFAFALRFSRWFCAKNQQRSVARRWKEDDELALTSAEEIWNLSNGYIRTEAIYSRIFEGRRLTSVKIRRLTNERRDKNRGKIPGDEAADRHLERSAY
ncbi:LRR receptor-like serine/threonine-protein kinase [Dorcoceras hygrometricum]|uniref:LRR receptor-like serine/threonine-protein kinase n=1 Tax=Dorcoceras hygrometricum TaxID=472368 RepID=A0A2Z7CL35_9LAMI|nr:LRR receptor-like serine/threonine-protein kinase [Dorcoceras hygrometricum]